MKKLISAFIICACYLAPATAFSQANKYFHDRIDTTIYATTTGIDAYTGTNTDPNFNVAGYLRGLMVSTFIVTGNTGACTYRLVTRTGALPAVAIKKQNGAALVAGDIPDSTAILLLYYGSYWRLEGLYSTASSAWSLTGNVGTVAGANFLGTTDAVDLVFKTNNTEKARISSAGILSLGLASTNNGSLLFRNSTNANTLTINSGVTSASYALTLPTAQGAANSLLLNDGAGALSWNTGTGLFWALDGNTVGAEKWIGTADNFDLPFRTNNVERMVLNTAGNLGVGTNPTSALHILPASSVNPLRVETFAGNTDAFIIDTESNVGVDVTPSLWDGNFRGFQVGLGVSIMANQSNFASFGNNYYYSATGYRYLTNGFSSQILTSTGTFGVVNSASGIAGNAITYFQRMYMNTSGDFAIGQDFIAPTALLHLKGAGADVSTFALKVDNSASAPLLHVYNSGQIRAGDASNNLFLGTNSGLNINTGGGGQGNTGFGVSSLTSVTTGTFNTAVGTLSLAGATIGVYNVAIGYGAMQDGANLDGNTCTGFSSGNNLTGVTGNTAYGYNTLGTLTGGGGFGNQNTAFGYKAMETFNDGVGNASCAFGANALRAATDGENCAIGNNSMTAVGTGAAQNTGLGNVSLLALTTGDNNTGLGRYAMAEITTGSENVAVGRLAGSGFQVGSSNNTIVGSGSAITGVNRTASNNTFLGYGTGLAAHGNANIFIGYSAGQYETSANKLIVGNGVSGGATEAARDSLEFISSDMNSTPATSVFKTNAVITLRIFTASQASAIIPSNAMIIYVSTTDGTFTSVGIWAYENGAWVKL